MAGNRKILSFYLTEKFKKTTFCAVKQMFTIMQVAYGSRSRNENFGR